MKITKLIVDKLPIPQAIAKNQTMQKRYYDNVLKGFVTITMNISLTPELEKFVQNKVESGMYTSASEVIRESLRLLHTHDELQAHRINQLNQEIDVGMQQLQGGKKILAKDRYDGLKNKINNIAKERK